MKSTCLNHSLGNQKPFFVAYEQAQDIGQLMTLFYAIFQVGGRWGWVVTYWLPMAVGTWWCTLEKNVDAVSILSDKEAECRQKILSDILSGATKKLFTPHLSMT